MIMVVIMVMMVVVVLGFEIGVDFELGVEVEALEVEHLGQRHLAEVRRLDRRTGFMCLMRGISASTVAAGSTRSALLMKIWSAKPICRRTSWRLELAVSVLASTRVQHRVEQIALGDLVIHEEGLGHGPGRQRPVVSMTTRSNFSSPVRRLAARSASVVRRSSRMVQQTQPLLIWMTCSSVSNEDVVVDVLLAELVLDHGDLRPWASVRMRL